MSFQSGIHAKMAIFDRKSHAPETSEGSESGSILLVRLFFICQATFLSFDILSVAWAERGFGGGLIKTLKWTKYFRSIQCGKYAPPMFGKIGKGERSLLYADIL